MNVFNVTVIIPVYNAEKFVEQAVESAINLEDVGEVILVEDSSLDDSLKICKKLEERFDKVKLVRHPNGDNRGVSASRNLGLGHSKYEYVAFLDADDIYLPNRFKKAREILLSDRSVDGVYDRVDGFTKEFIVDNNLQTFFYRKLVPWDKLLETSVIGGYGSFCTDGITVKKKLLEECRCFDTDLVIGEDTLLWWKIMLKGKLVHGERQQPVALYRSHANNTISKKGAESSFRFYDKCINHFSKLDTPRSVMLTFLKRKASSKIDMKYGKLNLSIRKILKIGTYLYYYTKS